MSKVPANIKYLLHAHCQQYVAERITSLQQLLDELQQSLQNETKSSAGDKFETSRAMVQAEQDRAKKQLTEAQNLKADLAPILPEKETTTIQAGSLVSTPQANYYLAIPAGKVTLDGTLYYLLSPKAPIAQLMLGKQAGEEFTFNGKTLQVVDVI